MAKISGQDNRTIDELLQLVDDGTLTELERSILTQSLDKPATLEPREVALVEELKQALQAAALPGEDRQVERSVVQSILAKLQSQSQPNAHGIHSTVHDQSTAADQDHSQSERYTGQVLGESLSGKTIGSYQILQLLGRGGMGAVYEATDRLLHRHVALKVMLPAVAANEQHRARFLREARAAARVEHDHICPIYQVGEDNGIAYIAMPLLVGETLERRLQRDRLSPLQITEFIRQIAEGLEAAHQAGLIHRDIKPANVWIESRKDGHERIRLLDFGLAQLDADEPNLTQPGSIMGTPAYMSPEQARGLAVDGRTDLFSVGAMLYELLTGTRAFVGKSPTAILSSILVDNPVSPAAVDKSCPKCLSDLALRLLEKDPNLRLPDAKKLLAEVAQCRQLIDQTSTRSERGVPPDDSSAATIDIGVASVRSESSQAASGRNRTGWLWPLVAAGGLGGMVLTIVLMLQTSSGTLVVEASDEAKILFEDGQLQILDEAGKVAYRLSAQAPTKEMPPGKYQVRVVGADGLSVDTESFVIARNEETHIRVTASKNSEVGSAEKPEVAAPDPEPDKAAASTEPTIGSFAGRRILNSDFSDAKQWPIPLVNNATVSSRIEGGVLATTKTKFDAADPFITIPLGARLQRGALVVRCRSTTGHVFFNFCCRVEASQSRFLSLGLNQGSWIVGLQRQSWKDGERQILPNTRIATSAIEDPLRAKENWVEVALRWSDKDFDIWIDGQQAAGGTLPSEELRIGKPTPPQICMRIEDTNLPTLEIDQLSLWDQSDIALEDARKYSKSNGPPGN